MPADRPRLDPVTLRVLANQEDERARYAQEHIGSLNPLDTVFGGRLLPVWKAVKREAEARRRRYRNLATREEKATDAARASREG